MGMNPRLLRPTASGFNPRSLAGLTLWLDADDRASLFDAHVGGSQVTADGDVGRWVDKVSGALYTQDTPNNRPKWRSAGKNGRGTVEFDGSNDTLGGNTTQYLSTTTPYTIAIVNQPTGLGNYLTAFSSKYNATNNYYFLHSNVGGYLDYAAGAGADWQNVRYTSASRGSWYSLVMTYTGNGATTTAEFTGRANGAALTRNTASAFGAVTAAGAVGSNGSGFFFSGQIAEIVLYNRLLSAAEIARLEGYLQTKWAP